MSATFAGFPQEGLNFLASLTDNNDRNWFNANKQTYLDNIVAPAVTFVETLGDRLQFISPHIQYDTRTNGQGSLMRIYRDVRFSKDKSPYKTWVGVRFWEGAGKKTECPGFFLWFESNKAGLYTGMVFQNRCSRLIETPSPVTNLDLNLNQPSRPCAKLATTE